MEPDIDLLKQQLLEFANNDNETSMQFPSTVLPWQRQQLHILSTILGLGHHSEGIGEARTMKVWKKGPRVVRAGGFTFASVQLGKTFRLLVGCVDASTSLARDASSLFEKIGNTDDLVTTELGWNDTLRGVVAEVSGSSLVLVMGKDENQRKEAGRIALIILAIWKGTLPAKPRLKSVLDAADKAFAAKPIVLQASPEQLHAAAETDAASAQVSAVNTSAVPRPPPPPAHSGLCKEAKERQRKAMKEFPTSPSPPRPKKRRKYE